MSPRPLALEAPVPRLEARRRLALLDPLAPREDDEEVWARLDARPPTLVVILKPDHVRDVDLFVRRYGCRPFRPWLYWRSNIPETELEPIEPGSEFPGGGLVALYDGRGRNETPLSAMLELPFDTWRPELSRLLEVRLSCSPLGRVPHTGGFLSMFRKGSALVVLIAIVSLVAAMSAFGGSSSTDVTTVNVTLGKPSEFKITVSKKTIGKGITTFKVTNKGALSHDFKISGRKTRMLSTGKSATLRTTLKKGKYAFLCTVPGHAAAGMKGVIVVK